MNKHIKLKKNNPKQHYYSNEDLRLFSKYPETRKNFWIVDGKINMKNAIRAQHLMEKTYKLQRRNLEEAMRQEFLKKLPIIIGLRKNEDGELVCLKCGSADYDNVSFGDGVGFWEHTCKCKNCGSVSHYIGGYGPGNRAEHIA